MLQNKKCCIDSSVWVKYAGHFKIATLLNCINTNSLVVFADNYLLSEIHEALVTGFDFSFSEADKAIHLVESISLITAPRNVYRFSPDPKDNYLYDICIQNNCMYLITNDKELLMDKHAPFLRKTDAWLKKLNRGR